MKRRREGCKAAFTTDSDQVRYDEIMPNNITMSLLSLMSIMIYIIHMYDVSFLVAMSVVQVFLSWSATGSSAFYL